ncbi:helix-turn-helix domain-containing protein [Microbacterium sp. ASV81]|uniref:helix-turn-helix domain-containing protein n=1 Tax=Microbacterium capsulatum TaxID=3041921 RepID=UPI0035A3C3D6
MNKADRLNLALRRSGLTAQQLAAKIDISRATISAWINGRNEPRRKELAAFALATGYPVRWLETGEAPIQGGPGSGLRGLPGLDSNQEPAG